MELVEVEEVPIIAPSLGSLGETFPSLFGSSPPTGTLMMPLALGPRSAQMGTPTGALMDPLLDDRTLRFSKAFENFDRFFRKVPKVLYANYR